MLPAEWHVQDEMSAHILPSIVMLIISSDRYNFDSDPRTLGATVVLAANESSYIGEINPLT